MSGLRIGAKNSRLSGVRGWCVAMSRHAHPRCCHAVQFATVASPFHDGVIVLMVVPVCYLLQATLDLATVCNSMTSSAEAFMIVAV